MTTFKINDNLEAVCDYKRTRNGFKHTATLLLNGIERESVKICYLNRTWESFEYQSVLEKLLDKANSLLSEDEKRDFLQNALKKNTEELDAQFGAIAMVAKMGEIFGTTQAEKNDWKARMIKAGLEGKGLIMPDDWNTLSEDEKEKRLNGVIGQLAGTA